MAGLGPVQPGVSVCPWLGLIGHAERRDRPPGQAQRRRRRADPRDRLERRGSQIDRRRAADRGGGPGRLEELLAGPDQVVGPGPDPFRIAGQHDAARRHVIDQQVHPLGQDGGERLHALDRDALGHLAENVAQRRMGGGEFLGPVPDRRSQQQFPAGRRPQPVVGPADAALVGDLEVADLLDRVAEELHPQRMLLGRREDVDDAAAHRDLAAGADQVGPGVADLDQPGQQVIELVGVALVQADRGQVTKAGHDGLQQAAHRGDHHRERPVRLARVARVGEPPQHRDPPPDRVGLRGEPLMRQGFPAGEASHAARWKEGAQGRGQVFGLAGGGGDREHEAVRSVGLTGQRGGEHRPEGRRRDEIFSGEGGGVSPDLWDSVGFRTRDYFV